MAKKRASEINRVVHEDAKQYKDIDSTPGMNACGGTPRCGNEEALEDIFVAATAHWFANQLKAPFHKVIYAPNRRVEERCSFDLSVGLVNTTKIRLRIQSKIYTGACDVAQTIIIPRPSKATKPDRVVRQVEELCNVFRKSKGVARPYLMIHQCRCLHEYRRMGTVVDKIPVPALDHALRSIAIDLASKDFAANCHPGSNWKLRITTDPLEQTVSCVAKIPNVMSEEISVCTLADLLKEL